MFLDIIMQLFAGCSNPIEYVTAFIFFYMCVEIVMRMISALLGSARRV